MKNAILVFVIAVLLLASTAIWIFVAPEGTELAEYLHVGIIVLIIAFAVFLGYKKLRNARRGEPTEDELSKKVMQKTAAISYYISLYLWVIILIIKDRIVMDTEQWIGTGVIGMAVTFAISWGVINHRGVRNG